MRDWVRKVIVGIVGLVAAAPLLANNNQNTLLNVGACVGCHNTDVPTPPSLIGAFGFYITDSLGEEVTQYENGKTYTIHISFDGFMNPATGMRNAYTLKVVGSAGQDPGTFDPLPTGAVDLGAMMTARILTTGVGSGQAAIDATNNATVSWKAPESGTGAIQFQAYRMESNRNNSQTGLVSGIPDRYSLTAETRTLTNVNASEEDDSAIDFDEDISASDGDGSTNETINFPTNLTGGCARLTTPADIQSMDIAILILGFLLLVALRMAQRVSVKSKRH